jgi:ribosome biogenesis GTPase / thiamine phosphate phosphatase
MGLDFWGWNEDWERKWSAEPRARSDAPGRVLQEHRDRWEVAVQDGKRAATTRRGGARPTVGDWVAVREGGAEGSVLIVDVLPRLTRFSRGAAGAETREQVVAANVDTVWVVHGVDTTLNPRRLERYLTLGWESGAQPVIVLTKADLLHDTEELERAVAAIGMGVPVRVVSAIEQNRLDTLAPDLKAGSTVALLGPSGAGKSSLINALLGGEELRTGPVRAGDRKGRHTTTWRQLVRLANGALLLDTPGMRELQLWSVEDGLGRAFGDIAALSSGCRFADCVHETEPGCAVKEAVELGQLDAGRLLSYQKLRAETAWQQRKIDVLSRQEAEGRIKAAQKGLRAHLKRKRR